MEASRHTPGERVASRCSRKIINVSHANRLLALKHRVGEPGQLVTIHNGIADTPWRANPWRPGVPVIAMVARFSHQKDHSLLLRAVAGLQLPYRLVFIGEGPTLPHAKKLTAELGISGQVEFLGPRLDVPEILANSHVFALATKWEGFPISILEAMRAGLPVIANAVGGVHEAIRDGDNGILVPPGDVEALREALGLLCNSPDLRSRMGSAGRKRYEKEFTLTRMLQKTFSVYESTLYGRVSGLTPVSTLNETEDLIVRRGAKKT